MRTNKKSSSVIKFILAIFIAGITSLLIKDYFKSDTTIPNAVWESEMIKTSNKINSQCPIMIDSDTRLDSTEIKIQNNEILYNYTYVNFQLADIDVEKLHQYLDSTILISVIEEPKMEPMKNQNVTFSYFYRDMNGEKVTEVSISPEEYNL